jgi:acetyltransferase-like isoleucine patch superfamily enzyme
MAWIDRLWGTIPRSKNSRGFGLVRAVCNRWLNLLCRHVPMPPSWRAGVHRWRGVRIGQNVFIGMDVFLDDAEPESILIENDVTLIARTAVVAHGYYPRHLQHVFAAAGERHGVVIRRGAYIGFGAIILPGVEVGEYASVGAGTVVTRSVPACTLLVGAKAEVLRTYNPPPDGGTATELPASASERAGPA